MFSLCILVLSCEAAAQVRVPAEWEAHAATWMQWPGRWERAMRPSFAGVIDVIQDYEPVHLLTSSQSEQAAAAQFLTAHGVPNTNITWHIIPVDNAWMRDNGPVYVTEGSKMWIQNWKFDAWGGNFGADIPGKNDNLVPVRVAEYLGMSVEDHQDYILEKGNLEFNGAGTLVLNWDCQDDRNPGMTQAEHETILMEAFGLTRIIWAYGHVLEDGTTGHIDGTARFIDKNTIAIADSDWGSETEEPLAAACEAAGLKVVRIPCPGETDYMNWYVGNGFVAAMTFGRDEADAAAKSQLETLFPGRDVYMLDASSLWNAGGGIHCVTNDQPFVRPLHRRPTRRVAPR